ncbi:MAG: hypothetical protein H7Z72_19750, partial [Bacteroidetes bacterium]|nr:hypothetical protein [Fibrella sp.]
MKKLFFIASVSSLLISSMACLQAQTVALKPVWETDTTLRTPECVLFEPGANVLYVACINGN